jgi:hypothetical protein
MMEPNRSPATLEVTVSGEITRFSQPSLVAAYERLLPLAQRRCRSPGADAAVPRAASGRAARPSLSPRPAWR